MSTRSILSVLVLTFLFLCYDHVDARIVSHSPRIHEIRIDQHIDQHNDQHNDQSTSSRHTRGKLTLTDQPEIAEIDMDYEAHIKDTCIALDHLHDVIDHINCSASELLITFTTPDARSTTTQRWREGTLLNGGFQWKCMKHIDHHERGTIIMRRVTSTPVSVGNNQLSIRTTDVSVMECFDTFDLKMNLNHTKQSFRRSQHHSRNTIAPSSHHFHPLQNTPSFSFQRVQPLVDVLDDGSDVRLSWSASRWENPTASITISLNRVGLLNTVQVVQSWNASLTDNGIWFRLPAGLVDLSPYFFSINYANAGSCPGSCCLNRCRADDLEDGLFYIAGRRNATLTIPSDMFSWSCSMCNNNTVSGLNVPAYSCQLCSQGYNDLYVRGACTDCSLTYSYSAYQLDVSLAQQRATLVVDVDAAVHADFFLDMQLGLQSGVGRSGGELALGQWSASFLGVNFQLSFDLDFDVIYNTNTPGPVNITGGFDARVKFGGRVGHRNGNVLDLARGSLTHQPHELEIWSRDPVDFTFAVQPHLRFDLFSIFRTEISCEIFGQIQSTHNSAPSYPALPPNTWWDERANRAINHTGVCTEPHLIRNLLSVGVRNNNVRVTFDVNILNVWMFSRTFNATNVGNIAVEVPVLASCQGLVGVDNGSANFTLYFNASSGLDFNEPRVVFGLTLDVARALDVHHSRVRFLSVSVMDQNTTNDVDLVQVVVVILPSAVDRASEQPPNVLITSLANQQQDPTSALRRAPTTRAMYVAGPSITLSSTAAGAPDVSDPNMNSAAHSSVTPLVLVICLFVTICLP